MPSVPPPRPARSPFGGAPTSRRSWHGAWERLAVVVVLAASAGCSGSSGALAGNGVVRFDLGRAPSPSILTDIAASELQSYGFPITNVSGDLIQTDWRIQDPSGSTAMAGGQRIRDRAEVFVRPRAEDYYVATARLTFEVLVDGRWEATEVSDATQEQYERLRVSVRERLQRYMNQN